MASSSDDESASGLASAYSVSDLVDELGSDDGSGEHRSSQQFLKPPLPAGLSNPSPVQSRNTFPNDKRGRNERAMSIGNHLDAQSVKSAPHLRSNSISEFNTRPLLHKTFSEGSVRRELCRGKTADFESGIPLSDVFRKSPRMKSMSLDKGIFKGFRGDCESDYEPIDILSQLSPKVRNRISDASGNYDVIVLEDEPIYENFSHEDFVAPGSAVLKTVDGRKSPNRGSCISDMPKDGFQPMKAKTCESGEFESPLAESAMVDNEKIGSGQNLVNACENNTYEQFWPHAPLSPSTPADDDSYSWGSSEFESYADEDENVTDRLAEIAKETTKIKGRRHSKEMKFIAEAPKVFDKIAAKLGPKSKRASMGEDNSPDDAVCLEFELNLEQHPHPALPPAPDGLDHLKLKRRYIVGTILDSEKSYMEALRRIIDDYEKPLTEAKPQIISRNTIRVLFYKVHDILQCHNMFHIELSAHIKNWDKDEEIGNIFTASFSKSIVFDVYSAYVNNFSVAMETAKKQARTKQAFTEFLKQRIQSAPDKLSLFGLMVKPVQRFPQFILLLQDLLCHTPLAHHDRLSLQLALTELENLTHKLNETKRESENHLDVKKIMSSLTGRSFFKPDTSKFLVRQDDMTQVDCSSGETKTKHRRLFMLNDQLLCTTVQQKETDAGLTEKYKFKWSVPIRDIEVVERADVKPPYQVQSGPGRNVIIAPKLDKSNMLPWKKELDDMLHDMPIIEQITQLATQLRLQYDGLGSLYLHELNKSLQAAIQQHSSIDRCILQLSLPNKFLQKSHDKLKEEVTKKKDRLKEEIKHRRRSNSHKQPSSSLPRNLTRMIYTFQVASPSMKQEWLTDLKNTKLALDPRNLPGWYVPENEQSFTFKLPLFIKPLLVDITRQQPVIECAVPVIMPMNNNIAVGTQHLWVCNNNNNSSQISIVSLHGTHPQVMESFEAAKAAITCAEIVPGYGRLEDEYAFFYDTVWLGLNNMQIHIQSVENEGRPDNFEPELVLDCLDVPTCLKFADSRIYLGLRNGGLVIYNRDFDGIWEISRKHSLLLGMSPINCLLPVHHEMWVASERNVHVIAVTNKVRQHTSFMEVKQDCRQMGTADDGKVIQCMVRAGVGLLLSFKDRSVIRIFHLETFKHLQDVNVASAVKKVLSGKDETSESPGHIRDVHITCMLASKGMLWVGTNVGCVVTFPLPRLEGVPQIKGRPCVSYHTHIGPVKFLVPIHCGMTPLHQGIDSLSCMDPSERSRTPSMTSTYDLDKRATIRSNGVPILKMSMFEDSDEFGFSKSDSFATLRSNPDGVLRMYGLPQNKWTSTPDLRNELHYSQDDITILYESLLRGTAYEDYESELIDPKTKRRIGSDMQGMYHIRDPKALLAHRMNNGRRFSKYNTLPIVMEDSTANYQQRPNEVTSQNMSFEQSNGIGAEDPSEVPSSVSDEKCHSHDVPPVAQNASGSSSQNSTLEEAESPETQSVNYTTTAPIFTSKSVIVVSGGAGHINKSQIGNLMNEDLCLLLWQCRL